MLAVIKNLLGLSKYQGVKILMYHHVLPSAICVDDPLYVTTEQLDAQLSYIKKHYNTVFFKDLKNSDKLAHKLIITFDDGYYNNLEYLVPLLEKHQLKATIFIPTGFIMDNLDNPEKPFMSFSEIARLNPDLIEIGLHSHAHVNLAELSLEDLEQDLNTNIQILRDHQIQFSPVLAYPYGRFPRKNPKKQAFFEVLQKLGITHGIRIGNKIESYPFKKSYEVNRIDIKKRDSLTTFKWKLRLGKLKL